MEHPAYSDAWSAFALPDPSRHGAWHRGICGGWSAHVEQGRYGHMAKKATWLYAYGVELPTLKWSSVLNRVPSMVSWCRNHSDDPRPRVGKAAAARTPIEFRDVLLSIARSAYAQRRAA